MNLNGEITKIAKAWYSNEEIGRLKQLYFKYLQHKYQFDEWHITPINFRPYAIGIVDYLNKQPKKKVVEIGCGLGEIIGNICDCERYGFDIDVKVIKAASKLYRNVHFRRGTFKSIKNQKIDYLITVNFIHGIPPAQLKEEFKYLCKNNDIRNWILDITDSPEYQFAHDVNYLFEGLGYKVKKRLQRYSVINGTRWVYILEKG